MKKVLIAILVFGGIAVSCAARSISITQRVPKTENVSRVSKINKPSRIEVKDGEYNAQIHIEFMHPVVFQKKEVKLGEEMEFFFPGIPLSEFKALGIAEKIKELPMVKNASVRDASIRYGKSKIPQVSLLISFEKNTFLLRVIKSEERNLLDIEIYDKSLIEKLGEEGLTTMKYACNNMIQSDSISSLIRPPTCFLGITKKKRALSAHKAHIIIDAGHGGVDDGARAFDLKEKELTLSIARKVHAILKGEGYRAFLTRNTDTTLSVLDRFGLAQQLKADLFVSIHINSAGGLEHVSGIETHFLDEGLFFAQQGRSQFFFVCNDRDRALSRIADAYVKEKITCSKMLSENIHNSLLKSLEKKDIVFVNRGVKRTGFRTLLRHEVPASMVEVGFITNKREAKRLTNKGYQALLAKGICNGIKKFLAS